MPAAGRKRTGGCSVRRKDREVTDFSDILSILSRCEVARLGLADEGVPYVVPLSFAYQARGERLELYFHCAGDGRKMDMIRRNPLACFEVDGAFRIRKDDRPCGWSAGYESVIGEGRVTVIRDGAEKKKAMDAILLRYGFEGTPVYDPRMLEETTLLKMEVDRLTGKRKTV